MGSDDTIEREVEIGLGIGWKFEWKGKNRLVIEVYSLDMNQSQI